MIAPVFGDEFEIIGATITEGSLAVIKACENCNYVVKENGKTVACFKSAIEFSKFMSSRYGELGDELAGLLCWILIEHLDDEEIVWLVDNNKKWKEFLDF